MKYYLYLLISISLFCCKSKQNKGLEFEIKRLLEKTEGDFAIAFQDLHREENNFFLNENEKFHAASTMKVPVMIEMYHQAAQGKFLLMIAYS